MEQIKHARVTTRTPRPDDPSIVDVDTKSYHEKLSSIEQRVEQSLMTSRATLASDLIECLEEIAAGETPELELKITTNRSTGEPERIVKTWTTRKENYGR
jgi:hypothetical protein